MREKEIEEYSRKLAVTRGWLVRKVKWLGRRGAPDRIFLKKASEPCILCQGNHRALFVEFKRPGGKPTPLQEREIERLRASGAAVYGVDSKEAADELFKT